LADLRSMRHHAAIAGNNKYSAGTQRFAAPAHSVRSVLDHDIAHTPADLHGERSVTA
jgi:hypothetical protein